MHDVDYTERFTAVRIPHPIQSDVLTWCSIWTTENLRGDGTHTSFCTLLPRMTLKQWNREGWQNRYLDETVIDSVADANDLSRLCNLHQKVISILAVCESIPESTTAESARLREILSHVKHEQCKILNRTWLNCLIHHRNSMMTSKTPEPQPAVHGELQKPGE